jgi:hypothetical protein
MHDAGQDLGFGLGGDCGASHGLYIYTSLSKTAYSAMPCLKESRVFFVLRFSSFSKFPQLLGSFYWPQRKYVTGGVLLHCPLLPFAFWPASTARGLRGRKMVGD